MNKETALKVLYLEDSISDYEIIREKLIDSGFNLNMARVEKEKEYESLLKSQDYDIILADFKLPGFDAFGALRLHNEICPDVPFICVSGTIGEEKAIDLIRQGAVDYVLKDRPERLPTAITRALNEAQEIKAREKVEKELHVSEEIFRCFMENSPIYIFFKDENIRALRLSKNYESMLGKPIHEMLGKNMDELFPSDLAKSIIADDLKILNEGKVFQVEEELNGRYYTTIKFPIHIEGKPVYLSGYTMDVTNQKIAEQNLIKKVEELQRFNNLTVNREIAMIELKKEVNELLKKSGQSEKYLIVE